MRILFFGDIIGRIGREAVKQILPELKKEFEPDLILANADNLAHGKGVTVDILKEMMAAGIDAFTGGNHFWSKAEEAEQAAAQNLPIIRPANYPDSYAGQGRAVIEKKGQKVLLFHLSGQVFINDKEGVLNNPFHQADEILSQFPEIKIKIVDFHAEATSEKTALGHYLDGRVSAVLGTHTHIPTADEQILPKGTAYITDLGMVGAKDSVIGVEKQMIIDRFLAGQITGQVNPEIPQSGLVLVSGAVIEVDEQTGSAQKIERIKNEVLIK